jgi:hypothetical protein
MTIEKNDTKAALAMVEAFEIHTHGILFGKPLNGINPHDAVKTIRLAIRVLDKMFSYPSDIVQNRISEESAEQFSDQVSLSVARDIFIAVGDQILKEAQE